MGVVVQGHAKAAAMYPWFFLMISTIHPCSAVPTETTVSNLETKDSIIKWMHTGCPLKKKPIEQYPLRPLHAHGTSTAEAVRVNSRSVPCTGSDMR